MRCEHCAVGDSLTTKESEHLPLSLLLQRLDELPNLATISITGGEPALNPHIVREIITPLLKYAMNRNIYTQVNSNLTLPLSRYEDWIEYVDVLHISYNYRDANDFHRIVFGNAPKETSPIYAERLFNLMLENAQVLSRNGVFVSAESLLSPFTIQHIAKIHEDILQMGCQRHEVHPLYPADFARGLPMISLAEYKATINRLIDERKTNIWLLFGTVPVFPCSESYDDRQFWYNLKNLDNVTMRQDPDGRNRLNVNIFTGDVYVTDFDNDQSIGNIQSEKLSDIFDRSIAASTSKKHHCCCANVQCLGPNKIVADTYYPDTNFSLLKAKPL